MDVNLTFLSQLLINGLIVGALYGVVAMCFVLIYKATQVVNFAQGEFLMIGAWLCYAAAVEYQMPFWLAFVMTLGFMSLFGFVLQTVVLRPLLGQPIISIIMVTIGLSMVFQATVKWLFGVNPVVFPEVLPGLHIEIGGLHIESAHILSLFASFIIMAGFYYFFQHTRWGLAMRATAYDQQVAQSLGIPVRTVFAMSWAISATVSALAGVILGITNGVSSELAFIGIKVFPAVIVGGMDSIVGAVVGGLIIGVLENMAEFLDVEYLRWGNLYTIAPFYVLIILLMIRPYGLFGTKKVERI